MAEIIQILGDIEWYRGDSFAIGMRLKDKSTNKYIDITGYKFLFTVNEEKNPADVTKQLFQVSGVVDSDQVVNKGWVYFTPKIADTANAEIKTYYYGIQLQYSLSSLRTIAKYKFKLKQDITKELTTTTEYSTSFINTDLTDYVLTIVHGLNTLYPIVAIYDDNNVLSSAVHQIIDSNTLSIDFGASILGTWFINIKNANTSNGLEMAFTNTDLNASHELVVNHSLGTMYPMVSIYDNNNGMATAEVEGISISQFVVRFGQAITGTWHLSAL